MAGMGAGFVQGPAEDQPHGARGPTGAGVQLQHLPRDSYLLRTCCRTVASFTGTWSPLLLKGRTSQRLGQSKEWGFILLEHLFIK